MHNSIQKLFLLCALIVLGSGCVPEKNIKKGKLNIVATTGMLGDAIKNIVKDSAMVTTIMGPGVDPHLYKASHGDLTLLSEADVVVYNGLYLEGKMGEVLEKLSKHKPVYAAGEYIPKAKRKASQLYQDAYDPHIWFDVLLWSEAVQGVSNALQKEDSVNAAYYKKNTAIYLEQLNALHKKIVGILGKIPVEQRTLVTAHDAFEYFGRAYNIEVKGLQGISTVSEAGVKDITNLVDFLVEKKIKAVFIETSVSQKALESVVDGCRAKGHAIQIGGSLYSDAMGQDGTPEGTYIGMVLRNANTITNALSK